MVASCAPTLVLICLEAQRPKADEPPAVFIMATMMPKSTKKIKIPTFPLSASLDTILPSSLNNMVFMVRSRLPFV